jgi:hypothetical protein
VFIKSLQSFKGTKDKVGFSCSQSNEAACAIGERYLLAFSEAGWPLAADTVSRVQPIIPFDGVVMVMRVPGGFKEKLPPHMGRWTKLDPSQVAIYNSFSQVDIALGSQGVKTFKPDEIVLYFGPDIGSSH